MVLCRHPIAHNKHKVVFCTQHNHPGRTTLVTKDQSAVRIGDFRKGLASTIDALAWRKVITIERGGPHPGFAETRAILVHPNHWDELQSELNELRSEVAELRTRGTAA